MRKHTVDAMIVCNGLLKIPRSYANSYVSISRQIITVIFLRIQVMSEILNTDWIADRNFGEHEVSFCNVIAGEKTGFAPLSQPLIAFNLLSTRKASLPVSSNERAGYARRKEGRSFFANVILPCWAKGSSFPRSLGGVIGCADL
jgi:hypothetical protein